jgi:hypothetical protein
MNQLYAGPGPYNPTRPGTQEGQRLSELVIRTKWSWLLVHGPDYEHPLNHLPLGVQITVTYPEVFYFSYVGTRPRHEGRRPFLMWAIKNFSYRLMGWHVWAVRLVLV